MCSATQYQQMLEAIRRKVDSGYSPERAHVEVVQAWSPDASDSCELLEDSLDYATITYREDDYYV